MDPWIGAGSVSAWIVPGVIFLVVNVACALGLLWIRSEHLETLHAVPLSRILDTYPTIARQIDDELTRRLASAGEQVAPADRVDRARLADLSERLRKARNPDWAPAPDAKGRWLGLSKLFARGT